MISLQKDIIVIAGPTASGKSSVALELAEKISGEIISADSMQIYKGLDIGTAKPTLEERRRVRHHLIDLFEISEPTNVYRWVELAEKAIREILGRRHIPIVAGGTGLYIRALIYGLDPLPADPGLKKTLEQEFSVEGGFDMLRKKMSEKDTDALKLWSDNFRKLLRAYEVFLLTGKSITAMQKAWNCEIRDKSRGIKAFCIKRDKEDLKRRIEERTGRMLASGWIEETKRLITEGLLETPTAHQALGYSIIGEHLRGEIQFDEMRMKIVTATWRYARRQVTWFKNKAPEMLGIEIPSQDPMAIIMPRCNDKIRE